MWREIKKALLQHRKFILTTHVNPDGDGIGAICALTELLITLQKDVRIVFDAHPPSKFDFLDYHHLWEVFSPSVNYDETEVVIILDTHKKERIGRVASVLDNQQITAICIDHHVATETFSQLTIIDPKACCVGAMVYTLFKESGCNLNVQAATGIYTSVICDTGRFSHSCTNRKAHKIADECIKLGVDPDLMYSQIFQHVSLAEMKMFAKALQHMETHLDNRVLIQQIFKEDYQDSGSSLDIENMDLEYFNDFNKQIEEIECLVLLRELPDSHVRVSLRSKSDLDISSIVKVLGGGGHSKAAGVTMSGSLSEVKEKILGLLTELLLSKK